ncbi:2-amino-4-hydroxy-6-hydroxymethyldihydropteridine diphosphokinase [Thalassolituus sp. LLYu03]|uniref:2-amino-4-hydroxy-6- hydroxymethyldihydropteridine diphosphokinase n=1 Tax=Thalassolituus sp. LLYu03 TaxID=3421656 RepID=UPI003D2766C5
MTRCYLGLGANLNDPVRQLELAFESLRAINGFRLLRVSALYGSKPLGPQDQPDYVNIAVAAETSLAPLALLDETQRIEREQGRIKLRHWGERCIDIDLLLFGDTEFHSERLTVPHKELCNRSFVVTPLLEIAPELTLPDGTRLKEVSPAFGGELHRLGALSVDL